MNSQTLLLRQIHPSFVQQGRVTSQAFRPTPKDEMKLSVYDGDQITPEEAFEHFTTVLQQLSVGELAVTVSECKSLDLKVEADPEPFPEHAIIDFTGLGRKDVESKGKKLKSIADTRGWLLQA